MNDTCRQMKDGLVTFFFSFFYEIFKAIFLEFFIFHSAFCLIKVAQPDSGKFNNRNL